MVAHNLTIISMQARTARYLGAPEAAQGVLDVVGDSAKDALRDLRRMLAVHLPGNQRMRGPASGEKLRNLRCQKLAEHDKAQGRAPEGVEGEQGQARG